MSALTIKEQARQHAVKTLGQSQYDKNPDSAESIENDFTEGFNASRNETIIMLENALRLDWISEENHLQLLSELSL